MDFLLGLLTMAVFFVVLSAVFYVGFQHGNKRKQEEPSEEEQRKQKQLHEDFQNLMNYDLETALQRKKVSE